MDVSRDQDSYVDGCGKASECGQSVARLRLSHFQKPGLGAACLIFGEPFCGIGQYDTVESHVQIRKTLHYRH